MILFKALNLLSMLSLTLSFQDWADSQQLVYDLGNEELNEVFIHFDNQTLEMSGNKDVYKCIEKIKGMTIHCIDTIAIQWGIKSNLLMALQMNESQSQTALNSETEQMNSTEDLMPSTDQINELANVSSKQMICCVLSELFDCMEYTIRKECNDNSFAELAQIHTLIAKESYTCPSGKRSDFCNKILRQQRQQLDYDIHITSGERIETIRLIVIMVHFIISFAII